MAGELVEVFGQSAWFACGECPADCQGKKFSLQSSDGEAFEVDAEALCLAKNVFKQARQQDAAIELPFKKAALSKIVEYLRYHKDTPPAEIRTPLASDNLAECGALKWDAAFINVERDMLFDLLVAGITMAIPSLIFLAGAKASLLIKGKAPDKLVKDFKVSDDLPEEESEALASSFAAQKEKQNAYPDESGLGGVALILNSIFQAAERNEILSSARDEAPGPSTVSLKSFRHASWRAMVMSDWTQLGSAPPEVLADRDLLFAALAPSCGQALHFAPDTLRADRALVLEAVRHRGELLGEASPALRSDRAFVREAVAVSGAALAGAAEQIQGDRDFVLGAVAASGAALQGAAHALRADPGFVLQCVAANPQAYKYAADELKWNADFALAAARRAGAALRHMPHTFQADRRIVAAAVASDPAAAAFAHTAARCEMKAPMPWDTEPRLAAKVEEQSTVKKKGEARAVDVGPRHMGAPQSSEAARECDIVYYRIKNQKIVQFSALSVMTANMGQANYIASNSYLDKLPFFERPQTDSITLMWGAVGGIGMRWKAFASQDMLNANPEALMSVMDAAKALHMTTTRMDPPEWYAVSFFDEWTRQSMLAQTAGVHSGGGARPGEDYRPLFPPPLHAAPGAAEKPAAAGAGPEAAAGAAAAEEGPLGGWPGLGGWAAPPLEEAGAKAAPAPPALELCEGARIALSGLQAKSGTTGTLLKRCPDGKWKVRMDDSTGVALLSDCYLVAIAPPTDVKADTKKDAAARRQKALDERQARLQARAAQREE